MLIAVPVRSDRGSIRKASLRREIAVLLFGKSEWRDKMEIAVEAQIQCTDGVCGRSVYVLMHPLADLPSAAALVARVTIP